MQKQSSSSLAWYKSSYSADGACVEVAMGDELVFVRHSKRPNEGTLAVPSVVWQEFIDAIKRGEIP